MQVTELGDRPAKVNQLGALISQLPTANYTLLRFLTAHLIHVVQNERINKMNLRNVGIVFSPTLGVPASLFSLLLTEFDIVFAVRWRAHVEEGQVIEPVAQMDGDQPAPGKLDEPVAEVPARESDTLSFDERAARRRSRNSMLYEASGADKLLEIVGNKLEGASSVSGCAPSISMDRSHRSARRGGGRCRGSGP
jgi:RalA-binding protein 1